MYRAPAYIPLFNIIYIMRSWYIGRPSARHGCRPTPGGAMDGAQPRTLRGVQMRSFARLSLGLLDLFAFAFCTRGTLVVHRVSPQLADFLSDLFGISAATRRSRLAGIGRSCWVIVGSTFASPALAAFVRCSKLIRGDSLPGAFAIRRCRPMGGRSFASVTSLTRPAFSTNCDGWRMRRRRVTFLSPFYGYPPEIISAWCCVSVRTARACKNGSKRPSRPVMRLFRLHQELRVLTDEWEGFKVTPKGILDPAGNMTHPNQLEHFCLIMQCAAKIARSGSDGADGLRVLLRAVAQRGNPYRYLGIGKDRETALRTRGPLYTQRVAMSVAFRLPNAVTDDPEIVAREQTVTNNFVTSVCAPILACGRYWVAIAHSNSVVAFCFSSA